MNGVFENFGIAIGTDHTAEEVVALARRAEELDLHSVWLAELYHFRSAIPLATAIGAATTRIKVGLGVLLTPTRHPALIAMESATLDEMNGGRLMLGLGVGRGVAARHGTEVSLLATLRDSLTIVRGMLRGETISYRGKAFRASNVRLGLPPHPEMRLYVGSYPFSPKALEIAGELADGVVYNWPTPHLMRQAGAALAEGAIRAGRDPGDIDVFSYFIFSVDDDERRARDACRKAVASSARVAHMQWRAAGIVNADDVDPVIAAFDVGGLEAAAEMVNDRLIDRVAIAGDPATCRDRLREYDGTGLTLPIAYSVLGPDPMHALELIARAVAI
jgi:5,10-methylenetetrahydromethanopterin reductase